MLDWATSIEDHSSKQFIFKDVDSLFDSFFSFDEGISEGSANEDKIGSKGQAFEYIVACPNSSIYENGNIFVDFSNSSNNFGQYLNSCGDWV